ncbi:MAG: glycine cleavage system protein GcvH [Myxococcota bacterium]
MTEQTLSFPDDCRYSESDEWVRIHGAVARIGLTDYAQSELSDVVFVELPETGSQVESGEAFGVVESVKAVSDLIAPISGELVEVNEDLDEHPEWVNEDPYGRGWIIAIAPEDPDAIDDLLSAEAYRTYVKSRADK